MLYLTVIMDTRYFETVNEFEYKGYKCRILRNLIFKSLTGYVKLPKGHKYYGVPKENIPVECHGCLTYGDFEGNDYVIGFDCVHAGSDFDAKPGEFDPEFPLGIPNKDEKFVIQNIEGIIDQLENSSEDNA